jgi:hypothetical protein
MIYRHIYIVVIIAARREQLANRDDLSLSVYINMEYGSYDMAAAPASLQHDL